jgi:CRISPR-associated protein Cas1
MKTLFIQSGVTRIRKRGELLLIKKGFDENSGTMNQIVSPLDLKHITLAGDHSISTGAIGLVAKHGGVITILDGLGHPLGQFLPFEKNAIINQYEKQNRLSSDRRLELAKMICAGSLGNRCVFLVKVMHKNGTNLVDEIQTIHDLMFQIPDCHSVHSLRGLEGNGAHAYFKGFKKMLPDYWNFSERRKNPSPDPVNALLSYGYGILYGQIRIALISEGLSPYYGFLHDSYQKQEALVFDFIEEFRQCVVDRVVLTFLNRKNANPKDFTLQEDGSCLIQEQVRKKFIHHIFKRLSSEVPGTNETYSAHINIQAKKLSKAIINENPYRPFLYR